MTANAEVVLEELPEFAARARVGGHLRRGAATLRRPRRSAAEGRPPPRAGEGRSWATARGSRSSAASRPATRSCCPADSHERMREILVQVVANLRANKLRSVLTMFGILWGVMSVVDPLGDRRGFPARQSARARGTRQERRHRVGRPHVAAGRRRARRPADLVHGRRRARARAGVEATSPSSARRFSAAASRVKSAYNAAALTVHGIEPQYQDIRTIDIEARPRVS